VNPLILTSVLFAPVALAVAKMVGAGISRLLKDHPSNIEISGPHGNVTVNITKTMTKEDINKKILEAIDKA
jgi:hypothetical protein